MVKILLIHGAVAEPEGNERTEHILQQAKKEIRELQASLLKEVTESLPTIPKLVNTIVGYVALDEILEIIPSIAPL